MSSAFLDNHKIVSVKVRVGRVRGGGLGNAETTLLSQDFEYFRRYGVVTTDAKFGLASEMLPSTRSLEVGCVDESASPPFLTLDESAQSISTLCVDRGVRTHQKSR